MADSDSTVPFADLSAADLRVDCRYLAGRSGTAADDPLAKLLPVGNQGGFRYRGSPVEGTVRLVVLYTSGTEVDWPDLLDPQTGIFTYYGDNRKPGAALHETRRRGNLLLRDVFHLAHGSPADRSRVPPFLLFEKAFPGRSVRFRGLLAPGAATLTADDDLTAIWRSQSGLRFQNYRARFTVLDVDTVARSWLDELVGGKPTTGAPCPAVWRAWVASRSYQPLLAPSTTVIRSKPEQLPADPVGLGVLRTIHAYFADRPHDFEECAVAIWRLIAPATGRADVTRPSRDGGRDAIGEYLVGPPADRISLDFALEAKCYSESNGVGVKEMSRLISRLRHRQFGVFVTLSYFGRQVYEEVRADGHPIALICGRDVVTALRGHGLGDSASVSAWLTVQFPRTESAAQIDVAFPGRPIDLDVDADGGSVEAHAGGNVRDPGTVS
ncbi:restriction endonuclease [Skermania piniformis]|uniref:Restriction endonuclease n=1 Tax=Skermania pinensis TaxID=39122 RepID=A0ABX8S8N5_9ACTN|nr:restriction endonuclease [Skermania piniformis]QXQ14215.1 restriction endonuclease [Skermania piniformis]